MRFVGPLCHTKRTVEPTTLYLSQPPPSPLEEGESKRESLEPSLRDLTRGRPKIVKWTLITSVKEERSVRWEIGQVGVSSREIYREIKRDRICVCRCVHV